MVGGDTGRNSILITEWKFKEIEGHPGYIICNDGTCYSYKRNKCKVMNLKPNREGYLRLRVRVNKGEKYLWVQRLVAGHFLGGVIGKEVHHKDNVRWNNHESNLEICDKSDNIKYRNINNGWKCSDKVDIPF